MNAVETVARWLAEAGVERGPQQLPSSAAWPCPHLEWAASGAMELSGERAGAPALAPGPVVPLLRAVDGALRTLTRRLGVEVGVEAGTVLGARAGLTRMTRNGRTSASGSTRLLPTADGWVAVSLARPDDLDSVPAMFDVPSSTDPWTALEAAARTMTAGAFTARVRLFGVPAAPLDERSHRGDLPWRRERIAPVAPRATLAGALVVDLSSLWAGPLCGKLLGSAGARVVKVESSRRPDGARSGEPRFFDWLHEGQESLALDLGLAQDRAVLAALLESADLVIEASRPRALEQLGVSHDQLELKPGVVWVGITGHGRARGDLVAFGDDAAVAGGLVATTEQGPVFCGDAIADPLTGVVAALGAVASRAAGGGELLDVAMSDVAAAFADAAQECPGDHRVERRRRTWFVSCEATGAEQRVLHPRVPSATAAAPALGADSARVLGALPEDDPARDEGGPHVRGRRAG